MLSLEELSWVGQGDWKVMAGLKGTVVVGLAAEAAANKVGRETW